MPNQDLISRLNSLKSEQQLGGLSDTQIEQGRRALLMRLSDKDVPETRPAYTLNDRAEFVWSGVVDAVLRPAMVGVGMFVMLIGGGMTSVGAAADSMPGDALYPVKIATEKAQLSLTASDERRAELHLQFATKRLQEASSLSVSDHEDKDDRVRAAVDAFKNEVAEATEVLETLEGEEAAVDVARAIDQKVEEYEVLVDNTVQQLAEADLGEEVGAVKEDLKRGEDAAVETLVTTAETLPESRAHEDLQAAFQEEYTALDTAAKLTLGRIAVIEDILATEAGMVLPEEIDLDALKPQLHIQDQLSDALNVMGSGGYRTAFTLLGDLERQIDRVTESVIQAELSIVSQRIEMSAEVEASSDEEGEEQTA